MHTNFKCTKLMFDVNDLTKKTDFYLMLVMVDECFLAIIKCFDDVLKIIDWNADKCHFDDDNASIGCV